MTTSSIEVDNDSVQAFSQASETNRRKLELLLRLRLRELTAAPARPLELIMDEMSLEAEKRGLTPEVLESLLNGDSAA